MNWRGSWRHLSNEPTTKLAAKDSCAKPLSLENISLLSFRKIYTVVLDLCLMLSFHLWKRVIISEFSTRFLYEQLSVMFHKATVNCLLGTENRSVNGENDLAGRFTWRIENFSTLNQSKLYSSTFEINETRWKLQLFPKGNNVWKDKYLSLYLNVSDLASLRDGWSITAKFSLHLINQFDAKKTIKIETEFKFNEKQSGWGFHKFYFLSDLHDKKGGYLVNDTCLIEVEVTELDALLVSTDKAESFLKSIVKNWSTPVADTTCEMPLLKDDAILAKECFNNLISIPLKDLVNPKHEMAMIATLSVLSDSLSLFSDNQAKEIMNLKATFPKIVQDWRESVEFKVRNQHLCSTFEKTNYLLEDLVKTEKGIKIQLEELNEKEKDLEAQLAVLRSKRRQLKEETKQVSKQTNQVYAIAEEQSLNIEDERPEVELSNKKLEDIEGKWASTKALFTT